MKISNYVLLVAFFLLAFLPAQTQAQRETIGTCSYTLGAESKTFSLTSLNVKFKTDSYGDPGEEKQHTTVSFSIYDRELSRVFSFSIKEDVVVNELKGIYLLRSPGGIQQGQSLRSVAVMIVNSANSANTAQTTKGNAEVFISGSTVKITIKNAEASTPTNQLLFEFSLSTEKATVKVL